MGKKNLHLWLLMIACCVLLPTKAKAQNTYGYSSISYDPNSNTITAYAETNPDYNTQAYRYNAHVTSNIKDANGNVLASQNGYQSVSFSLSGNGSSPYTIWSGHYMTLDYGYYVFGYDQCGNQFNGYAYLDYYDYQNRVETPLPDESFPTEQFSGPGPTGCYTPSADMILGGTTDSDPKVDIQLNGTTVTNKTVNVVVGQQMNLTTVVKPSSGTVANSRWTVPGGDSDRIANYVANSSSATVTTLTSENTSSVLFYWISSGSTRTVQYTATVNGSSVQARVTFNVQTPTGTITAATNSITQIDPQQTVLELGDPASTPGIVFTRTISIPSGFSGSTQWVQVFAHKNGTLTGPNGTTVLQTCGLDGNYPYLLDSDATAANLKTSDSPDVGFPQTATAASTDYSATMWLMFRPTSGTNPIWVPLRKVSWAWSAAASKSGSTWTVTTHSDPQNLSDSATTDFPVWTVNADSGQQCSP